MNKEMVSQKQNLIILNGFRNCVHSTGTMYLKKHYLPIILLQAFETNMILRTLFGVYMCYKNCIY